MTPKYYVVTPDGDVCDYVDIDDAKDSILSFFESGYDEHDITLIHGVEVEFEHKSVIEVNEVVTHHVSIEEKK